MTREAVVQLIQESIGDLNASRDEGAKILFSADLQLNGAGSPLDSLDFVNFALELEERLRRYDGTTLDLFEESKDQPSYTVSSLADFLLAADTTSLSA